MYISEVHSHFRYPSLPITINMAPTVTLVPGRKKNQFNAILDGFRFCKDKTKNGNTYYRCSFFSTGCKARITLNENNDLVSPTPDHNHESQVAGTHVHVVKRDLRRKAATSDLLTQYPDSSPRREPRSGPTTIYYIIHYFDESFFNVCN